jgi:hypothetical protein
MPGEIRALALQDLTQLLQTELGQTMNITNMSGLTVQFIGLTNDTFQEVETNTQRAMGRITQVVLKQSDCIAAFGQIPVHGYKVEFVDLPGQTFTVKSYRKDNTLGVAILDVGL